MEGAGLIQDIIEAVKGMLEGVKTLYQKNEIISIPLGIISFLLSILKFVPKALSFFRTKADLHPFYSWKEVSLSHRYFIETTGVRSISNNQIGDREKLLPYFLNKAFKDNDDQRFYLILSESGMGKTTFLINLYLRYSNKLFRGNYKIDLMPLWHPKTWERLMEYPEDKAKDTILLLDSLDEDPKAIININERINEIIDNTWNFRKIIITSSTLLFPNQESEPSEIKIPYSGSYHSFLKIYLAPFDDRDIRKYINKRFSVFRLNKRRSAIELIKKSPALMSRPLLLSFLDDLILTKRKFKFAYEVYESLIDKWINREAVLLPSTILKDQFKSQLEVLCKDFTFALYIKYKEKDIKDGFHLNETELTNLTKSKGHGIDITAFKTKALISRDNSGFYKFSHFSVFEYFLAKIANDNLYDIEKGDLVEFKNAQLFYNELFYKRVTSFFYDSSGHISTIVNGKEILMSDFLKNGSFEEVENLFINGLKNISFIILSPLKNILKLQVINTPIISFEGISKLKKLTKLNFDNSHVDDLTPLRYLTDLEELHLKNGVVTDISALSELSELTRLDLENNKITDISPLRNLKKLKRLSLANNRVKDLTPLYTMDNLWHIFLAGNNLNEDQIDALRKALPNCPDIDDTKTNTSI